MPQMLFLNTARMKRYAGMEGARLRGGGSWVDTHFYGHEIFNFRPFAGHMYGYVRAKDETIEINRLGAQPSESSVDGILAIWCATQPGGGSRRVVGWYQNATVFRKPQNPPVGADRLLPQGLAVGDDIGADAGYQVTADARDCHLLAPTERVITFPTHGRGWMSESNVWYADSANGKGLKAKVAEFLDAQVAKVPPRERRKYGGGGEGPEHLRLKKWCAKHPEELGVDSVTRIPGQVEHGFVSGDRVDVMFDRTKRRATVIEVETNDPMPGAHQAIKYRALLCAQRGLPLDSPDVEAILVAWEIPPNVRRFCDQYGIRWHEKRLASQ